VFCRGYLRGFCIGYLRAARGHRIYSVVA
jgi:hypothetical protein